MPELLARLPELVRWREGLISPHVFSSNEIYDAELERVFARCWMFLAHESQIPNPGDYFTTYVGADPVVVIRQKEGTVGAFLNACRHRGVKFCRAEMGNAKSFMCPYHGWTYGADGSLINVPNLEDGYYGELAVEDWGLIPVTQVASYKGLVFGTFDRSAPSLTDYLGDMAFYFDTFVDRRAGGSEVVGGVHKWVGRGNWKLAAEQFQGDAYHASVTHLSMAMAMMPPELQKKRTTGGVREGGQFSSRLGHGLGFSNGSMRSDLKMLWGPELSEYYEEIMPEVAERLGEARLMGPMGGHHNIFPSFSYLPGVMTMRVWHPKGPNEFETWSWVLVDKDAPQAVKDLQRKSTQAQFSPTGVAEQDDSDAWGRIAENLERGGPMVHGMTFNYQMGLGHEREDDDRYPGQIGYRPIGEGPQRAFYRRWLEFMTSDAWPHVDLDTGELVQAAR